MLIATVARAPAIDTPWPDLRDPAELQAEIAAAALEGYAGKLCIHPDQLKPAASAFTPSLERIRSRPHC